MKRHRQHPLAAALTAVSVLSSIALSSAPPVTAATALFAEGSGQPQGDAQEAFNGAFCAQNTCRSIGRGPFTTKTSSRQIQTAVDATPGDVILVGYSLGASGMYDRMREWEKTPAVAPEPQRVVLIVTYGNPENKFGGSNRKNANTGLPAVQPYPHLDVTTQYDNVADAPTRWGFYSAINLASRAHFQYFEADVDINDPNNLVYQDGNTTYMLIEAKTLPMLKWVQPFVSEARLAELDAKYRPLVERDYDRPDYIAQGDGADWGNGNPPPTVQDLKGDGLTEPRSEATAGADERTALTSDTEDVATTTRRSASENAADVDDETDAQQSASEDADDDSDADAKDPDDAHSDAGSETTRDADSSGDDKDSSAAA